MRLAPSLAALLLIAFTLPAAHAQTHRHGEMHSHGGEVHSHDPQGEVPGNVDGDVYIPDGPDHWTPSMPYTGEASIPAPPPRALRTSQTGSVTVNFLGAGDFAFGLACRSWPAAAQSAFVFATTIWGGQVDTPVDVVVDACWSNQLPLGALGGSAANAFVRDFSGAPQANVFYQVALANALANTDLNGATAEMTTIFSTPNFFLSWYFGTDGNTPPGQQDFVTVVLHEIGHGLGFAGSAGISDGSGFGRCSSFSGGQGCINNGSFPYGFDLFVEDGGSVSLLASPPYTNPSSNLATILTGGTVNGNANLFIESSTGGRQQLYTPSTYAPGSTYSHFNTPDYPDELMKHALTTGRAIHDPGLALSFLEDFGWSQVIPVELTAFDAQLDGADVVLQWATASETNNSGFEIEVRAPGATDFAVLDFVTGAGTTSEAQAYAFRMPDLAPGTYTFRLRQLDFDGRFEMLPEAEVEVGVAGALWLTDAYPNPIRTQATVAFAVPRSVPVRVVAYDLLGRPVQTLYDGTPAADTTIEARFDATQLASGVYVVEIVSGDVRETQRVTVVR
ncbi:MAG: T9SS type A sorting domain-containing protein [Bacteroidota bacterium]